MRRTLYLLALVVIIAALSLAIRGLISASGIPSGRAPASPDAVLARADAPDAGPAGPPSGGAELSPPADPAYAMRPGGSEPATPTSSPSRRLWRTAAASGAVTEPPADTARAELQPMPPSAAGDSARDRLAVTAPPADTAAGDVAAPPATWQASPRQRARDSAFVMVNSGRLREAIDVLAAWAAREPTDTAVVLDLARLYARAGEWGASIAQYSNLVAQHRTAPFLFERGQTYLWAGDDARGLADLLAAESVAPRVETQRQLGDYYRWQGALKASAYWYHKAEALAPGDSAVRLGLSLLERAYADRLRRPGDLEPQDVGSAVTFVRDNAGYSLRAIRLSRAFRIGVGPATALTASVEQRSASTVSLAAGEGSLGGVAADLALSTRMGGTKVTASIGALDHDGLRQVTRATVTADALVGGARVSASWRQAPGYELLWAPRLLGLACCAGGSTPVTARAFQGAVSLPFVWRSELWASGEYLMLREDVRTTFQLALRRALFGNVSLLYAGSLFGHERWSPDYYSPDRYLSQSLGLEWARYREHTSFAARLSPGYAWVRGDDAAASDDLRRAVQLAGGLEFGVHRGAWDIVFSSGVGSARTGGYRAGNAALYIRRAW